jgi:hypothetical protein
MSHDKEPVPYLLIGTSGVEISAFVPPDPGAIVHTAQPWVPHACRCGARHSANDPATIAVLVGRPQVGVHLHELACGIAISPEGAPWNVSGVAEVSRPTRDFNPAAREVVRHLTGGVAESGLICFDLADLVSTVCPARPLHFSRGESPAGLLQAARVVVEQAPWLSPSIRSVTVGAWSGPTTTLAEINDAAALVADRLGDATIYLFTPLTTRAANISVLGA